MKNEIVPQLHERKTLQELREEYNQLATQQKWETAKFAKEAIHFEHYYSSKEFEPPAILSNRAKEIWNDCYESLRYVNLKDPSIRQCLSNYCFVSEQIEICQALIQAGDRSKQVWLLFQQLSKLQLDYGETLGLTINGRIRLAVAYKEATDYTSKNGFKKEEDIAFKKEI